LQFGSFFRHDRPFDWANLKANTTVNTGRKIDPIPVGSFFVFARTIMNTGYGTSIDAICYAFANIGYDRVCHGFLSLINLI
jgi:hypothetical protein